MTHRPDEASVNQGDVMFIENSIIPASVKALTEAA
jgi:hypothetical protein